MHEIEGNAKWMANDAVVRRDDDGAELTRQLNLGIILVRRDDRQQWVFSDLI